MLRTMPKVFLGFGLAIGVSANAFAGFSMVTKGDKVCRVEVGVADSCLPLLSQTFELEKPTFEIFQYMKVRERFGNSVSASATRDEQLAYVASSVLSDEQVRYILNNYEDISARNIGFGEVQTIDGKSVTKFYASVFVKSAYPSFKPMNFTFQVEGELQLDPKHGLNLSDLKAAGKLVGNSVQIRGLSDDKTEANVEAFRYLEKAMRYAHYTVVGVRGSWSAVNQKTIEDVKTIIAPVVFGRVVAEVGEKIIRNDSSGNVSPK